MANDFVVFAGAAGANVYTQSAYLALNGGNYVANGNLSGIADSKAVNKVARQASIMATVLAQYIADISGANSVDDGTTATLLANMKVATKGRLINVQTITATQAYTPTTGTNSVIVTCVGGGAGGGGAIGPTSATQCAAGTGGGGGGFARKRFTSGFTGITATIGAAGVGVLGANGTAGGTTSFGGLLSASGGQGGAAGSAALFATPSIVGSATGGAGSSGDINGTGGVGQYAVYAANPIGGAGGSSFFGGGANISSGSSAGVAAVSRGSGGGGGCLGASNAGSTLGGNGVAGLIVIEEYA